MLELNEKKLERKKIDGISNSFNNIASFILSVISSEIIIPILRKLKVGQIERRQT